MQYEEFIDEVMNFEFVPNRGAADAMIKAVLGLLASRVDEGSARILTAHLPRPLTFERLRGHQEREKPISFPECEAEVARQFKLSREQSNLLIHRVFHLAREAAGGSVFGSLEERLPADWILALEEA